jgi:protoporphyrinogen oxidase
LNDDYLIVRRKSGVYMFGKYFDWPLGSSSVFKMPLHIMLKSMFDLLAKPKVTNPDSFTEYTIAHYGKTLYTHFFKFYTEKFIRVACEEIHADWASAGINRAVIDKRVDANSLLSLVKGVLLPKKVDTDFIYPRQSGIDTFCHNLAGKITEAGGKILTSTKVVDIVKEGTQIREVTLSNGEKYEVERLVWSGEILSLAKMLEYEPFPLKYLSMVCYNVAVKGKPLRDYQWTYFADRKTTINRVTICTEFNPNNAPPGYSCVNVEITCFEGDRIWQKPEAMLSVVKKDLVASQFLRSKDQIGEIWMERVPNTYPIYDLNYRKNLLTAMGKLSYYKNLLPLGRCGTFWYNNMDHSMKMSMDYAEHILTGKPLEGKDAYWAIG